MPDIFIPGVPQNVQKIHVFQTIDRGWNSDAILVLIIFFTKSMSIWSQKECVQIYMNMLLWSEMHVK